MSDTLMEDMLIGAAKKESESFMTQCFDEAAKASNQKAALLGCKKEGKEVALDARALAPNAPVMEDNEFAMMLKENAEATVADIMTSITKTEKTLTGAAKTAAYTSKMNTLKAAMKKSMATTRDIQDVEVKTFIKKGSVKRVAELMKVKKVGATDKDNRKSIIAALKETLGKPDTVVTGADGVSVTTTHVTGADAEMYAHKALVTEVGSVFTSCLAAGVDANQSDRKDESTLATTCETKAETSIKETMSGAAALNPKQLKAKLNTFRKASAIKDISSLKEGCLSEGVSSSVCKTTIKNKMKALLGKATIDDKEIEEFVLEGSQEAALTFMESCLETKTFAACRTNEAKKAVLCSRGKKEDFPVDEADVQETLQKGSDNYVKNRISACIRAADKDAAEILACTSEAAFTKDLKTVKTGGSSEAVTKKDIVAVQEAAKACAVQEAAAATKDLPAEDKLTMFRSIVKENVGLDLETLKTSGKPIAEVEYLSEAAASKVALGARACSNAGTAAGDCAVDKEFDDIAMGKLGNGRRLAKADTKKIRIRHMGRRFLIQDRIDACGEIHSEVASTDSAAVAKDKKAKMKHCLEGSKDFEATYIQIGKVKTMASDIRIMKSLSTAKAMKDCYQAEKVESSTIAAKKIARDECKVKATAHLTKIDPAPVEDTDGKCCILFFGACLSAC